MYFSNSEGVGNLHVGSKGAGGLTPLNETLAGMNSVYGDSERSFGHVHVRVVHSPFAVPITM